MRQNIYDDETFFAGYQDIRAKADNFNNLVEQPAFRALLPPLTGATVLDLGCGFGDLAAYCVGQGAAWVVATDISARMLAQAREQNPSDNIEYRQAAMEDVEFAPESFNLVVSSLALHYSAYYAGVVARVASWLKPGGVFVYSVEHPAATAQRADQGWIKDDHGAKLYWPVDDYADEGRRDVTWTIPGVAIYHRTLTTLLNTLTRHGLTVTAVGEPTASDETIARLPEYVSTRRFPPFLLVASQKSH